MINIPFTKEQPNGQGSWSAREPRVSTQISALHLPVVHVSICKPCRCSEVVRVKSSKASETTSHREN